MLQIVFYKRLEINIISYIVIYTIVKEKVSQT